MRLPPASPVGTMTVTVSGDWSRAMPTRSTYSPVSFPPAGRSHGRFKDRASAYSLIYLADERRVALLEVNALLHSPMFAANPFSVPYSVHTIRVTDLEVLDMTEEPHQVDFDTTAQELTGDWRGYRDRGNTATPAKAARPALTAPAFPPPAATQRLGEWVHANTELDGILAVSARFATQSILVVFQRAASKLAHVP